MDVQEFRKEFLESVKIEAAATGEGSCASFVQEVANYLIEAEVLPDFTPSFYVGNVAGRGAKKYRVDGYVFDEFDGTMILVIADFNGIDEHSISKTISNNLFSRLAIFVDQALNTSLHRDIEISTPCADLVDLLRSQKNRIRKYRFMLFTDGNMSTAIKALDTIDIDGVPAECQIWDMDRLFRVCCSETGRQSIEIDFTEYIAQGIPCLPASDAKTSEYNSYLCIIPGETLANIYDKYGSQLLEGNVRSFLSTKVAVNKKIRETILKAPDMFFAYNNGVSATAKDVKVISGAEGKYLVAARDFQIINGGQTTASLSNTRHKDKAELQDIYVQMKLTEIDEADPDKSTELIRNISRSSNSQNKVSDADFFATHPFHIRMEQISRRLFAPAVEGAQYETKWFYERARGQYLQAQMRMTQAQKKQFLLQNPKDKLITKTDLAKVRNTWAGMPQWVSKGAQTNFMKFAEIVDGQWSENDEAFNERYFQESVALMILFRHLEKIIPKQSWYEQGYRANIVTYSIALLRECIKKQFKEADLDLMIIWNHQAVPDVITRALEIIAEKVYIKMTDPSRPTINVTQWCKRDGCWKGIQDIEIKLPSDIEGALISRLETKKAVKEAKADQKIVAGVEAQMQVVKHTGEEWKNVSMFALTHKLLSPEDMDAMKYACLIPNKIPNATQSKRILAVLDRVLTEGFKF